jgi:hypothetical protein
LSRRATSVRKPWPVSSPPFRKVRAS